MRVPKISDRVPGGGSVDLRLVAAASSDGRKLGQHFGPADHSGRRPNPRSVTNPRSKSMGAFVAALVLSALAIRLDPGSAMPEHEFEEYARLPGGFVAWGISIRTATRIS